MKITQSCLTLCDPMDYTIHGSLQAKILDWVTFPFSRGFSQPRDWTQVSNPGLPHCRQILYPLSHNGSPKAYSSVHFSHSVVSNSLRPHGLQHTRPPCPSANPGVYSNSCPLNRCCHPTTSSSVVPFSSHLQSFPASGSFKKPTC